MNIFSVLSLLPFEDSNCMYIKLLTIFPELTENENETVLFLSLFSLSFILDISTVMFSNSLIFFSTQSNLFIPFRYVYFIYFTFYLYKFYLDLFCIFHFSPHYVDIAFSILGIFFMFIIIALKLLSTNFSMYFLIQYFDYISVNKSEKNGEQLLNSTCRILLHSGMGWKC